MNTTNPNTLDPTKSQSGQSQPPNLLYSRLSRCAGRFLSGVLLLIICGSASADIVMEDHTFISYNNDANGAFTTNITLSAKANVLVVGAYVDSGGPVYESVTFGGVTPDGSIVPTGTRRNALFYWNNPTTNAADLVIDSDKNGQSGCATFILELSGVDVSATPASIGANTSTDNPATITTTDDDMFVVDFLAVNNAGASASPVSPLDQVGSTFVTGGGGSAIIAAATNTVATPGAQSLQWTVSSTTDLGQAAFAFATYVPPGSPSVVAQVNPTNGGAGQSFTVTATVTPGVGTVTNVTVDLGAIGGPSAASLVLESANVYTNSFTVPGSVMVGTVNLTVSVTDDTPLTATDEVQFTVLATDRMWDGGSLVGNNWSDGANWVGDVGPAQEANNFIFAGTTRLMPDMDGDYGAAGLTFDGTAGSFILASSGGNVLKLAGGITNDSANAQTVDLSISNAWSLTTFSGPNNITVNGDVSAAHGLTKFGAGELTMTASNSLTGTLLVKSGTLTLDSGSISQSGYGSLGHTGTDDGTLTLKGTGSFSNNNDFNVGDVGESVGTLNIQDDASLTVNAFFIGSANATGSTASGTVNQTGGTVTELSGGNGAFCIGGRVESTSAGGIGVYNLSGGTLNATAGIRVGSAGQGTFNQTGGTVNANLDVNIARLSGSIGTYNFDGGELRTTRVTSSTSANATFNFNGGVLIPRQDTTTFVQNLSEANVRDGGVVVDTANFNVTINQSLQHSYLPGDKAIDGGLTKRGAGTLTLAEMGSYYTGPTVVTGGALNLSPISLYSLNDLTLSNATLGLSLNGGTASYYATNLNLAGDSALNFSYDLLYGTPITAVYASGSLTDSGTTVINLSGYGFTVGQQFTLVDYSGAPLANLNHFSLGALPIGVTASLSNNTANTSIDLVVTAVAMMNWIPLVASDAFGTSSFNSGMNWLGGNPPSAGNGYFTETFTLRSPADSSPYAFGGDVLSVDAGGRFILKGTDGQVITVPTLILNGGVVDYAVSSSDNNTETLTGSITLNGGLTSHLGALGASTTAETLIVNAPIGGDGNLQVNGVYDDIGVVVLAATNTYAGTTTVAPGTLLVNGSIGTAPTTVHPNRTLGGSGTIGGPVTVQAGGTLAPGIPSRGALTAALGTLTAGNTTVDGTVLMKIDRAAVPTSDKLVAPSAVVNPGASLAVDNLGSTNLVAGDTFTLFSTPVTGTFDTVTLPPLPQPTLYWTNLLAVDGTIAVASSVTTRPTLTNSFDGTSLSLSWPAGQGWVLQWQTNDLNAGLGANWVDVPGSTNISSTNITVDQMLPTVFYRLTQ